MSGEGVGRVADSLRSASEGAARAGQVLAAVAVGLPAPPAGLRLDTELEALAVSWADVLADLVSVLAQLAGWMDAAVAATVSADTEAEQIFRGVPR